MISELQNSYFSRHLKRRFMSEGLQSKLAQSANTDKHQVKPEMEAMKFNKIATQLRPIVKALKILGGSPISISTKPDVVNIDNCSTILPNISKNGGENQFKKKTNFDQSEYNGIILNSSPQKLFYLIGPTYLENEVSTSDSSVVPKPEALHIYEAIALKWSRPAAWYSYVLNILTVFSLFIFFTNISLQVEFPVRIFSYIPFYVETRSDASNKFNALAIGIASILKLIETVFLFCNSHEFVVWLNRWSSFERQFSSCFETRFNNYNNDNQNLNGNLNGSATQSLNFDFNICRFRNKVLIFYYLIPCVVWFVCTMSYMPTLFVFNIPFVGLICFILATFSLWGYPLVEDCKVFLMFKSIELTFKQIRLGIQKQGKEAKYITTLDVIAWRNLITETRNQTTIGARYLKIQQMIAVAETIIACSCGLCFVLISNRNQELDVGSLIGTVYHFLYNFLRLYCKILLAENITAEELRVAETILEIEGRCATNENGAETAAKTEIVDIVLSYKWKWVILILHRRYVCAQVVTYIIVIMQFQSGKN